MVIRVSLILALCFSLNATGLGQMIVEDINVEQRALNASFTSISIHGHFQVWLSQDAVESVAVSADNEPDVKTISTVVKDGVLIISGGRKGRGRVYISFKTLKKLELSGVSKLEVAGSMQQEGLHLVVSGVSEFSGAMSLTKISVDVSGVSKVHLTGKAENSDIISSGTAIVEAADLEAGDCTVLASGTSLVKVAAARKLTVTASGSSKIVYRGSPVVIENLTGVALLEKE